MAALEGQEFVMLRIEIIGNLGSEPEQRFTAEGVSRVSIRAAVNSRRVPTATRSSAPTGSVRAMGSKAE